jgi:hypothetical protein
MSVTWTQLQTTVMSVNIGTMIVLIRDLDLAITLDARRP